MKAELLSLLVRPFAKFCVRHSIRLQDLTNIFKDQLVIAARSELEKQNKKVTASRLSVMTGVHRKDLKSILEGDLDKFQKNQNIVIKVIGQWQSVPEYQSKAGKPRVLSCEGVDSEFFKLVHSVSSDLNPYTILFELERIDLVVKTEKGVKLNANFYSASKDLKSAYNLLGNDLDDLIRSVEENVEPRNADKHLHLKTEYDRIPVEHSNKVKNWLFKEGSKFHQKVQKYMSKYDADVNQDLKKGSDDFDRIMLASFSYQEHQDE